MPAVRLGAIAFVNTIPIYHALASEAAIDLQYDVPARLNARMLAGELDVSPVSSACYLRNRERLVLLEDLSVSSPGAVESVIFLSRQPLSPDLAGLLDTPAISVPDDSETSVALLAYLLHEATGEDLRPWFRVYQAGDYRNALEESGNALVIGDHALMLQEQGIPDGVHCYDLSTLWRERTDWPFVFAVWVADRDWAEAHPEELAAVNRALVTNRRRFFDDADVFRAGLHVAHEKSGIPRGRLERYFRQALDYRLTEEHRASLEWFGVILNQLDRVPAVPSQPQASL